MSLLIATQMPSALKLHNIYTVYSGFANNEPMIQDK